MQGLPSSHCSGWSVQQPGTGAVVHCPSMHIATLHTESPVQSASWVQQPSIEASVQAPWIHAGATQDPAPPGVLQSKADSQQPGKVAWTHLDVPTSHASNVHGSPSPHSAADRQQPGIVDQTQLPPACVPAPTHETALQGPPEAQSVVETQQPGCSSARHSPTMHKSVVQGLESLHTASEVQQPGPGVLRHWPSAHASAVQGMPSSHSEFSEQQVPAAS